MRRAAGSSIALLVLSVGLLMFVAGLALPALLESPEPPKVRTIEVDGPDERKHAKEKPRRKKPHRRRERRERPSFRSAPVPVPVPAAPPPPPPPAPPLAPPAPPARSAPPTTAPRDDEPADDEAEAGDDD
jgi:hypothetical protein